MIVVMKMRRRSGDRRRPRPDPGARLRAAPLPRGGAHGHRRRRRRPPRRGRRDVRGPAGRRRVPPHLKTLQARLPGLPPGSTVVGVGEARRSGRGPGDRDAAGPARSKAGSSSRKSRRGEALWRRLLRGGAFKPRTSPYSFQGLGRRGLKLLARGPRGTGLAVVTEVMTPEAVAAGRAVRRLLQIGARNMQNFNLLQGCGKASKPVLSSAASRRRSRSC